MKKYYVNEDEFLDVFCKQHDCNDCAAGTDQNGEPYSYGCDDRDYWLGDEEHQLIEDCDYTVFVSLDDYLILEETNKNLNNKIMELELIIKKEIIK